MKNIIKPVVEVEFRKAQADGTLLDIVKTAIGKFYRSAGASSWQGIKAFINKAIHKETVAYVQEHIENNIQFKFKRPKKTLAAPEK